MDLRTLDLLDRRHFLKRAGLAAAAGILMPRELRALARTVRTDRPPAAPIRVRGRVQAGGRGIGRAVVSDGLRTVATDADGRYELVTDAYHRWVSLSLPPGHRVPTTATGTSALHRPIRPSAHGEMRAEFALERLPDGDEDHAFLLLADTQTEDAWEMRQLHERTVPDVRETVRALGGLPAFGVACGDIMYDNLELYPDYERAVRAMGLPFFQVVGNHDLDLDNPTDDASTATFEQHFGPGHYSFNRGAVHYVVLDDVFWQGRGYLGYLSAQQLAWLEADLAHVEPGSTVVVFVHIPALTTQHTRFGESRPSTGVSIANRQALYRLLEPFRTHIMSGHTHETEHVFESGVHEHVHGTVCGAWWSGPICNDGTPNGYGVYEIRGEELRWRYKATGEPADHQLRVYPRGADPDRPDEIVANVWSWDPEWTVGWYQDGERRGRMARGRGHDPLAVELHAGPDLPTHRPWVDPMPTEHLFYAPVSPDTREVRVEATDRFGSTYSATARAAAPTAARR